MIEKNALIGVIRSFKYGDLGDVFSDDWTGIEQNIDIDADCISDAVNRYVKWYSKEYGIYSFYKAVRTSIQGFYSIEERNEFCKFVAEDWDTETEKIGWVESFDSIYFYQNDDPIFSFPINGKDFSETWTTSFLREEASVIVAMIRNSGLGDIRHVSAVEDMENIRHFSAKEIRKRAKAENKKYGYILAWESYMNLEAYYGEIIIECVAKMWRNSPEELAWGLVGTTDHDAFERIVERMGNGVMGEWRKYE